MSRTTTTVTDTTQRIVVTELHCDLCGKSAPYPNGYRDKWDTTDNVDVVTISRETGYGYPDGGSTTTTFFDVCPECWDTKIVPWFIAQKVTSSTSSREW